MMHFDTDRQTLVGETQCHATTVVRSEISENFPTKNFQQYKHEFWEISGRTFQEIFHYLLIGWYGVKV